MMDLDPRPISTSFDRSKPTSHMALFSNLMPRPGQINSIPALNGENASKYLGEFNAQCGLYETNYPELPAPQFPVFLFALFYRGR